MNGEMRCAICQKPTQSLVCLSCKHQWDQDAPWVRDLVKLERYWRHIIAVDEAVIATHISVDGHLSHEKPFDIHFLEQTDAHTGSEMIVNHIEVWAAMGGLTVAEQHAYQIMKSDLESAYAAAIINDIEHHHVTASAYRRRKEKVIHKIQQAMQAGEIDTQEH